MIKHKWFLFKWDLDWKIYFYFKWIPSFMIIFSIQALKSIKSKRQELLIERNRILRKAVEDLIGKNN